MNDETLVAVFCDLEIMDLHAHLAGSDPLFDMFQAEIEKRGLSLDN